jgi:hypothetical protein
MKTGKYSWLRKNPLVLLIRKAYQFLQNLFKPKKRLTDNSSQYQVTDSDIPEIVEVEDYDQGDLTIGYWAEDGTPALLIEERAKVRDPNELITIGQLFEEVEWLNSPAQKKARSPKVKIAVQPNLDKHDLRRLATVDELFKQVKWRIPPSVINEQILTANKIPQTRDVSRN